MILVVAAINYFFFVGIAQLALSVVWLLCAAGLATTRSLRWFGAHSQHVALFNIVFFGWGLVVYTVCHALTFGSAYVSHDTIVDWQPFIPFGDWVLQQHFGDQVGALLGSSMHSLRALWWVATLIVWIGTLLTFRRITRVHTAPAI